MNLSPNQAPGRLTGVLAALGGALSLGLAPIMVTIKYMTGWAIIPEPSWVEPARRSLERLFPSAEPPLLWTVFGTAYTVALLLLLAGLLGLRRPLGAAGSRSQRAGYWLMVVGLIMVIPGDAIHTWTWHQHGLTTPTPGTNPLANTAYAVHMMGMNFVMVGSVVFGVSALRRRSLAPWAAWSFTGTLPAAIFASVTLLPTTPSGALWLFSAVMLVAGYFVAKGQARRLAAA
jgi:hypothetical protein